MLDILLIIVFIIALAVGARRGLVMQLVHLLSFIVAVIVAYIYYKPLANLFVLWIPYPGFTDNLTSTLVLDAIDVDRTFYRIFAFGLIFFVVKIAMQIVGSMFDFLMQLPILKSMNYVLGAVLCFAEIYFMLFIGLYVVAMVPLEGVQAVLNRSIITSLMLEHTPVVTSLFQKWWYIYSE